MRTESHNQVIATQLQIISDSSRFHFSLLAFFALLKRFSPFEIKLITIPFSLLALLLALLEEYKNWILLHSDQEK